MKSEKKNIFKNITEVFRLMFSFGGKCGVDSNSRAPYSMFDFLISSAKHVINQPYTDIIIVFYCIYVLNICGGCRVGNITPISNKDIYFEKVHLESYLLGHLVVFCS